jgi:hypothetical protein
MGKTFSAKAAACTLALLAATWVRGARADCTPESTAGAGQPPVQVTIQQAHFGDYFSDHVEFSLDASLVSPRSLTVNRVSFDGFRVNGIPVFAAPLTTKLVLHPGVATALPQPVKILVFFRDAQELDGLQHAITDKKITVEGLARLTIGVNPLARMIVHQVIVPLEIHAEIPITVPGPEGVASTAAAALAKAASWLTPIVESTLDQSKIVTPKVEQLYRSHLMLAYSRYSTRTKSGEQAAFLCSAAAFEVDATHVILTREMVEPWEFDPEIREARDASQRSDDRFDLWLWKAGAVIRGKDGALDGTTAMRLSAGAFKVGGLSAAQESKVFLPKEGGGARKARLASRDGAGNLALLQLASPDSGVNAVNFSGSPSADGVEAVVFRFPHELDADTAEAEAVLLKARDDKGQLLLDAPVDSSAWGSPLITAGGAEGMVLAEQIGIGADQARAALNFAAPPAPAPAANPPAAPAAQLR